MDCGYGDGLRTSGMETSPYEPKVSVQVQSHLATEYLCAAESTSSASNSMNAFMDCGYGDGLSTSGEQTSPVELEVACCITKVPFLQIRLEPPRAKPWSWREFGKFVMGQLRAMSGNLEAGRRWGGA